MTQDTDRRTVLTAGAVAALAGAAAAAPATAQTSAPAVSGLGTGAAPSKLFRTTEIASGKVMGIANGPVWEFRGIPYGAPTGGKNRYMPPKPPAKWAGVRECFAFGQICPQVQADIRGEYGQLIMWDRQVGGMGEDCLVLNVWTPADRGAKKPVFVSFHGGGFSTGSGNAPGFDGKNLAAYADAVVVTINHRLASFGYAGLANAGAPDAFRYAGVCGALDMVAALQWVRDNVEAFGGDPGRVMIFGQSGGGAKTSTVLAMPPAKGLFHTAAVQSGSALRLATPEAGAAAAELLLKQLGLTARTAADIQKLSWQQILEAQTALGLSANFSPVIGTDALPNHPFDPAAPEVSKDVPIIVSTTLEDAALSLTNFGLTEDGLKAMLDQRFGGKGKELLALYRRYDPIASPFLIQAQVLTDSGFRRSAFIQAARKAAQGGAPAYMYQWNWRTPAYDGKFGAVHGIDVSASFHSYRDGFFAGSTQGKAMADRLASAWGAFVRTGDPNNPHLPKWEPYADSHRAVMLFDDDTRQEINPRAAIRAYWDANAPAMRG